MTFGDKAINWILTILMFLGGIWIRALQERHNRLAKEIQIVRDQYQRRDDAHRDFEMLKDMFDRMDRKLDNIDKKLDTKADK